MINYFTQVSENIACVAALGESRACTKPPALPYLPARSLRGREI
jgi:hypothetical protein